MGFYWFSTILLLSFLFVVLIDFYLLFQPKAKIHALRNVGERLSNGDDNTISVFVQNSYSFSVDVEIVDEIPEVFQIRNFYVRSKIESGSERQFTYILKPRKRGEYWFGAINIFVQSPLRLVMRRWVFNQDKKVAVYPSFLQMKRYELMAISNKLSDYGVHKLRKIGQSLEFEQIKNYVVGDDVRNINWKASARRNEVMLNHYRDERSQSVYCLLDKGRVMKMPFEGMTLLDYSINAALAILSIALKKEDKVGLVCFSHKIDRFIKAERSHGQIQKIHESLYSQKTDFLEPDYEKLVYSCRSDISQRSLLILFTNFESQVSLDRQLEYIKVISKKHLLLVVFFQNTELAKITNTEVSSVEQVYVKTIAQKFEYEKRVIVQKLNQLGVLSLLTKPANLSTDLIAKYLEIKNKGLI